MLSLPCNSGNCNSWCTRTSKDRRSRRSCWRTPVCCPERFQNMAVRKSARRREEKGSDHRGQNPPQEIKTLTLENQSKTSYKLKKNETRGGIERAGGAVGKREGVVLKTKICKRSSE